MAAAVAAVALAAAPALAAVSGSPAAQASPAAHTGARAAASGLSVHINAMNPQVARAGATVNVRGTITNGTRQTQAGLEVQLYTSATHFTTRDGLKSYTAHGEATGLVSAGESFLVSTSLTPGSTISWSASFEVSAEGISTFGVYPVTAELQAVATLGVLSSDRTLLPYWPASQAAAGLQSRLKISWLWPLIDQPHHQACTALTDNGLAAGLGPDGRLSALLSAGSSHADAGLTWMIDPALLSDVATMSSRYQVGGQANCTGATSEPASSAAVSWLTALRKVTAAQPTVLTPYANVDMPALVHQGLTKDLAAAYSLGRNVGDGVLRGQFGHDIAWPAGGTADLSVLTNLAAAEHVGTVVLTSSQMPALPAGSFEPDDAVTSLRVAGLPLNVLLSDSTLTGVLRAGDTSSGSVSKSTEFDVRQRFLAETAMIAAEFPESARTIVVAPPYDWSPSQALADDLLDETASAPWLAPAPLAGLSSAPDTQRGVHRKPPPAGKSPGELSAAYLNQVRAVGTELAGYKSMLYKPDGSYTQLLDEAMIATESAAWRGRRAPRGEALAGSLSRYVEGAERKVKIIASAEVPMGGSSGLVPFSVQNGLLRQTIAVRVVVSVDNVRGRTSQLTVSHFQDVLIIAPGGLPIVKLPVSAAPQGSTRIYISLASADGTPLPFVEHQHQPVTVLSTRYGRAILFLIGAAIGILVLTSVFRGFRRRLRGDANVVSEEADPPGSVGTGTSDARYPTEAPDDLADARRWADDP
jgi:hypothetical protein